MSGSVYGKNFTISSWGESHGKAIGVVIDGCPAGLILSENDIQIELDRRKPGSSPFSTTRKEMDTIEILSGLFKGKTTGTPISLLIKNTGQYSSDYSELANAYRPGHADYTYDMKYGFRDYRGGGRSSGRETATRVAAGAVAKKILSELGISLYAYTQSIGPITIDRNQFDKAEIDKNVFLMPDHEAALKTEKYLIEIMEAEDSVGGVVECVILGLPGGVGEPVFDKLDAELGKAILSIGAVKGIEFGTGFEAACMRGSIHNDALRLDEEGNMVKCSHHSGGILGGISEGFPIRFSAAFKPTPSIHREQKSVTADGKEISLKIGGRHDPVIVPRAVVVVEAMTAIVLVDQMFRRILSNMDLLRKTLL